MFWAIKLSRRATLSKVSWWGRRHNLLCPPHLLVKVTNFHLKNSTDFDKDINSAHTCSVRMGERSCAVWHWISGMDGGWSVFFAASRIERKRVWMYRDKFQKETEQKYRERNIKLLRTIGFFATHFDHHLFRFDGSLLVLLVLLAIFLVMLEFFVRAPAFRADASM